MLVLDLKANGTDGAEAKQTTLLVVDSLSQLGTFEVVARGDLAELATLTKDQAQLGCDVDTTCLRELTANLSADFVVSGSLGRVGKETLLNLALIDSKTAAVRSRVSAPLPAHSDRQAAVRELVASLIGLGPDAQRPRFQLDKDAGLSFAVFDLDAAGVKESVAKNLTQLLATQLKQIDGASVIGRDDIAAMIELEAEKAALGCEDNTECLAELGDALGVDHLVVGSVGQVAGSYVISLRLVATKDVKVETRVTETFAGSEAILLDAIAHAGKALLGLLVSEPGAILVTAAAEGAEVTIDGQLRGALPLRPITGLSPGRHEVRVTHADFFPFRSDVYIASGQTLSFWAELQKRPPEFYETWTFWTAMGGVGIATVATAGAIVGGVFGYSYYQQNRKHPFSLEATIPVGDAQ